MLTLRNAESTMLVAPENGGAIGGWTFGETRLLRMPLPAAVLLGDVHGMAGFPLLPYANRIGQARFDWNGRTYDLRRNMPGHPHALHGVGWARPWQIEALTESAVHLSLRHHPDTDWPFAFRAEQHLALSADALHVMLSLTNEHTEAAPAGIGLHPYFPRGGGARLRFAADGVWRNDATLLPCAHVPVPAAWDHADGRMIGEVTLDNCFTGWRGPAVITWDTACLIIEADGLFDHLQVYTPPAQDFFCVEPVSHAPDAINQPGWPSLRILASGETLSGHVHFRIG